MIVLDASVVVDLLLNFPSAAKVAKRIRSSAYIAAPHLIDAEVGQVLRRQVHLGRLLAPTAETALEHLAQLPITRASHLPLLARAFELRANLTFYDGLYVALAELVGATLLTRDAAIAGAPGVRARVELVQ